MGLGELKDAAVRERRRRLRLLGVDMAAAVRRPRRAQLGGAHRLLAADASSEERSGSEDTLTVGLHANAPAPRTSSTANRSIIVQTATGQEARGLESESLGNMQDPVEILLQDNESRRGGERRTHHQAAVVEGEGPPCSNVLPQSLQTQLTGAPSHVDGGWQTHRHAVVEGPLCSNVLCESCPQAQLTHAALVVVDGGLQTHRRTTTATSTEEEDSDGDDSTSMPIFVRHGFGELTCTVSKDESTKHLMQLYAQRTKTTLDSQYFVYQNKILESNYTWLSYGLKRDTTVHVCTRLLGGADHPNLRDYFNNNKHNFVKGVSLADGSRVSLEMTPIGCQFLSSWIRCLTKAFITGRSWNGKFELDDFKFAEGHVYHTKNPTKHIGLTSSVGEDVTKFANIVESIFQFNHIANVVSSHPPYVQSCMKMLSELVGPSIPGPLTSVTGALSDKYKLLLDTLVCCMTSIARQRLIIELYRKYEGADSSEISGWQNAINDVKGSVKWRRRLSNKNIFGPFIQEKNGTGKPYSDNGTGAFTLLRDVVMHATDWTENHNAPKFSDGIELMIPANEYFNKFFPYIIKNLIEENIDISAELSAAIRCACNICDP